MRGRRLLLEEDFKDFDNSRRGAGESGKEPSRLLMQAHSRLDIVTKAQFARVLDDVKLTEGWPAEEVDALMDIYSVRIGRQWDVHYRQFITDVENAGLQIHKTLTGVY